MSKIVFVTPNFGGFAREEPVGTLLLATILRQAGLEADILQFHHFGDVADFDNFIDRGIQLILSKEPKIVSFYTRCDTYHITLRIAQRLKERSKELYIVFGGPQADLSCEYSLREIPYIDFICCGEGETTVVPFFTSLLNGQPDLTVRGLAYRSGGEIVRNPRPDLIADLDTLPVIDYSLLDFCNEGYNMEEMTLFPVDVGRGCPFGCTYCSTKTFWGRKYRLKSPERIIQEIKEIHGRFGFTNFNFEHDMFTLNREKIITICGMLKELDFPIKWRCSARIDCLDEELVDIMVDAGLISLFMGIETGSPRMQKLVRKNLKLEGVPEKLRYICSKNIKVTASFIYGFPNETEEDLAQTIQLMTELSKLPNILVHPHLCAFFAGTELTDQYFTGNDKTSKVSDVTGEIAVEECKDIIYAHPVLFPHFFEYKTPFREKVQYYPVFFRSWKVLRPVYEYLAEKYYQDRLCDMLFDYTDSNREILQLDDQLLIMLGKDKFLDRFDEAPVLKEIARFLLWKKMSKPGSVDTFKMDVRAFLTGVKIGDIEPKVTTVLLTKNGNRKSIAILK